MNAATFGELAQAASERLRAAVTRMPAGGLEPGEVAGSLVRAGQVVHVLTRYLDDLAGAGDLEVLLGQEAGGGRLAAAHAREALVLAATSLGWAADVLGAAVPEGEARALGAAGAAAAAELSGAAAALAAGRDLLGTHVTADDPAGPAAAYWPAVITSAEVSGALADQVGQWSGQLAEWARRLLVATTADLRFPGTTRQDLASAHQWLRAASTAIVAARDPGQLAVGQLLLPAIPASMVPGARPLTGPEPGQVLCEGIAVSAARLRAVACTPGHSGGRAPELTAESWRWTATATAVIADISGLLLSALAEQADPIGLGAGRIAGTEPRAPLAGTGPDVVASASGAGHAAEPSAGPARGARDEEPADLANVAHQVARPAGLPPANDGRPGMSRQFLADAAQAAAIACDRWREVVTAWGQLTTETKGLAAPGVADTSDLVIRLGRLTFTDPMWAPARSKRAAPRDPARLAPDKEQAAAILAAVHDAADALAAKSVVDLRDVEAAVGAMRLHAPTSTLPEYYDIPRPYGPATPASSDNLVEAYQVAVTASQKLAVALDAVAVQVGAPSQVLALARAVISAATEAGAHHGEDGQHEDTPTMMVPEEIGSKRMMPGPVERQVSAVGAADPMLLLRARAIDKAVSKATQELVTQAQDALRQSSTPALVDAVRQPRPSATSALAVAAQSFPQGPSGRMPGRQGFRPDSRRREHPASQAPEPARPRPAS